MSTIKSSDEHLTLNADGTSKDIKFQANGVEKASISSSGAFTSTTIDATKLTGDLPAISGAALTGVGVAGISSSADATAITIDSSENVGIATTTPNGLLTIGGTSAIGTQTLPAIQIGRSTANAGSYRFGVYTTAEGVVIENKNGDDGIAFNVKTTGQTLQLTTDGRGLSQFTAKAWVNFDGAGTVAIRKSHNVSSVTDNGTGDYTVNFSNNLNSNSPMVVGSAGGNVADVVSDLHGVTIGTSSSSSVRVGDNYANGGSVRNPAVFNVLVFGD